MKKTLRQKAKSPCSFAILATFAPETGGAKSSRMPDCPANEDRTPTQLAVGGGCDEADGAAKANPANAARPETKSVLLLDISPSFVF